MLRSFQVDLSNNPSLAALLTQIRGSQVKVTIPAEPLQGVVLGLEKKQTMVNAKEQSVEAWVLNLIAGGIVRSIPLDEVQGVELEDTQLQEELHKALLALTQARDQAKKPVVISFEGVGERRVRVGYIILRHRSGRRAIAYCCPKGLRSRPKSKDGLLSKKDR